MDEGEHEMPRRRRSVAGRKPDELLAGAIDVTKLTAKCLHADAGRNPARTGARRGRVERGRRNGNAIPDGKPGRRFYVQVEGISQAVFSEISGLAMEMAVEDVEEGGNNVRAQACPGGARPAI